MPAPPPPPPPAPPLDEDDACATELAEGPLVATLDPPPSPPSPPLPSSKARMPCAHDAGSEQTAITANPSAKSFCQIADALIQRPPPRATSRGTAWRADHATDARAAR